MTSPGGRNANVTVTADVSGYTKAIGTANAATLQFANALKKIDDGVLSITKKIGVGAMAAGGGGLLAAFGDVKQAAQLQQAFSALSAQATQTGTKVGEVTTGVQKMSTQIPVATASLAQMATQIAALGVTGTKNILTLTKQAEQLAAATNTAPGQLFSQLLQMNQSLGGSIQNLERYGSALTTLQNKMGTSANDVMQMSSSIQAVGQKAGMTEQNILGVAAAFVKVGADGTAGATAFNQIMSAMTDSVSRNSTQMLQFTQVMGMTTDQFRQMVSNDPTQAFTRFISAIQSEGPRASLTLQALGLDSTRLTRVFAALSSSQANLTSSVAQANDAFNQNSSTATAAAAAWDTLDSTFSRLHNSVNQVKDLLGGPLLGPINAIVAGFTHLTDAVSGFIHFADDAPWPIGDTLTSMVTKTPALLLLGGAFITLTASLSKFLGVYRMMSGAIGVNAFRGLSDGLRGNMPREIDGNTGRLGSMLYRTTYGMGQRRNGDYGINAGRGLGSMIMGYPMMRARQQMGQAWDTLKHPFNPDKRDPTKTDPLSTYGMSQSALAAGKRGRASIVERLRAGDAEDGTPGLRSHLADRLEAGMGSFDESAEGLKRRRFHYVNSARVEATQRQLEINRSMGHSDLADTLQHGEASRYYEKNGTLNGYAENATNFKGYSLGKLRSISKDHAAWVGNQVGQTAGKEFDSTLGEKETAQLANPFKKLATSITEISAKLVADTGDAIKAIFAKITEWYGQAVTQIKALANEAKISMTEVRAFMDGGPVAQSSLPPVPGSPIVNRLVNKPAVPGSEDVPVVNRLVNQPAVPGTRAAESAGSAESVLPMGSRPPVPGSGRSNIPAGLREGETAVEYEGWAGETAGPWKADNDAYAPQRASSMGHNNRAWQEHYGEDTDYMREAHPELIGRGAGSEPEPTAERQPGRLARWREGRRANRLAGTTTQAAEEMVAEIAPTVMPMPMGATPPVPDTERMSALPPVPPATVRTEQRVRAEEEARVARTTPRPISELVREGTIGYAEGSQILPGVGPRRGLGARGQAGLPGSLEEGLAPGMQRGGQAGIQPFRGGSWRNVAGRAGSWVANTAAPKVGELAVEGAKSLKTVVGGVTGALGKLMSPQLMIAATLLGPTLYGLVKKIAAAHDLVGNGQFQAGASTATQLGQQALTPQQIAQQYATKTADSNTSDLFNDTNFANSKGSGFQDNHKDLLAQLNAVKNSKLNDADKSRAIQLIFQREAAGDVMHNGGSALTDQQKSDLAGLAMAYTGDQSQAKGLLGGNTASLLNSTGQGVGGYYTSMAGAIEQSSGNDRTTLLKQLSTQASDDQVEKGTGIVGLLSTASQVQDYTGGNTWSYDRANRALNPVGGQGGHITPQAGGQEGFGNDQVKNVLGSYVKTWNDANPNSKLNMSTDIGSVQEFASQLQGQADGGNDAAKQMVASLKAAGINLKDLAKNGSLSAESLGKLRLASDGVANAKVSATGAQLGWNGKTLDIQGAYQGATGDTTGKSNILDLLNNPDKASYTRDIDRTMSNLYKSYGGNDAGTADPTNAQAFRKEAEAIEQLKQTVATGSQQWQQLDQLEQTLYGKSATATVGIGGGLKEQVEGATANLNDLIQQQTDYEKSGNVDGLNALAPELDTQKAALEQSTNQVFNQINQYRIQVRDFHIQQQREQKDHDTQMTRMQRDYQRQTDEANYEFYQVQIPESNYQYKKSQDEQLYQFNEQLRLQKYAISKTWGSPTSMVQAQFTQGADSALLGLNKQTADLQKSNDAMNGLSKAGVSTDVIRTLGLDDPKNFEQAQRYLSDFIANPALVKSFNDSVAKNLNISSAIASNPNNSQFAEMQKGFDHTSQLAAESFAHSADLAMQAFVHSMQQSKISYDTQMQDFQSDYDKATARSLDDLSRLGEDTQATWQSLVDWAQNSGIPGVENLATAGVNGINAIQAAAAAVSTALSALPGQMNTAITQVSASLQAYMKANPALANAFMAANGITPPSAGAGSGQTDKGQNQQLVQGRATLYGWGDGAQWDALQKLINRESGFNNTAQNPTSTAYGMFQFLDGTWAGAGGSKTSDPTLQTQYGLAYIANRYGNPINAWAHEQSAGWYAAGAIATAATPAIIGEAGPEMVLPLDARGAGFMARTTGAVLQKMGINPTDVRRNRVAQGMPMQAASNMSYHHTDASTHFNGAITVVAQDPNAMLKALQNKKRQLALTRPMAKR